MSFPKKYVKGLAFSRFHGISRLRGTTKAKTIENKWETMTFIELNDTFWSRAISPMTLILFFSLLRWQQNHLRMAGSSTKVQRLQGFNPGLLGQFCWPLGHEDGPCHDKFTLELSGPHDGSLMSSTLSPWPTRFEFFSWCHIFSLGSYFAWRQQTLLENWSASDPWNRSPRGKVRFINRDSNPWHVSCEPPSNFRHCRYFNHSSLLQLFSHFSIAPQWFRNSETTVPLSSHPGTVYKSTKSSK